VGIKWQVTSVEPDIVFDEPTHPLIHHPRDWRVESPKESVVHEEKIHVLSYRSVKNITRRINRKSYFFDLCPSRIHLESILGFILEIRYFKVRVKVANEI